MQNRNRDKRRKARARFYKFLKSRGDYSCQWFVGALMEAFIHNKDAPFIPPLMSRVFHSWEYHSNRQDMDVYIDYPALIHAKVPYGLPAEWLATIREAEDARERAQEKQ